MYMQVAFPQLHKGAGDAWEVLPCPQEDPPGEEATSKPSWLAAGRDMMEAGGAATSGQP